MATTNIVTGQTPKRDGLLARYSLTFFFLLAFIFTWGYFALCWTLNFPNPLLALGAAGPAVSAFLVLSATSGKSGVIRLLKSYIDWRVGIQWYLITLIGAQFLMFLCFLLVPGALGDFQAPNWSFLPLYISEFFFTIFLVGGPLLEEGGWRGFALPRLQQQCGPLVGTIILGIIWSLWHLPFFFGPIALSGANVTFITTSIAFIEFTIGLVGVSILMTWVLNNANGSVLIAILLHAALDQSPVFIKLFPSTSPYYIPISFQTSGLAIVFGITALLIILFTRGRLGYDHALQRTKK